MFAAEVIRKKNMLTNRNFIGTPSKFLMQSGAKQSIYSRNKNKPFYLKNY